MRAHLVRVESDQFVAGAEVVQRDGVFTVRRAAPILGRFEGKPVRLLRVAAQQNGWKLAIVKDGDGS